MVLPGLANCNQCAVACLIQDSDEYVATGGRAEILLSAAGHVSWDWASRHCRICNLLSDLLAQTDWIKPCKNSGRSSSRSARLFFAVIHYHSCSHCNIFRIFPTPICEKAPPASRYNPQHPSFLLLLQ